jgi:hypothetical protein
MSDKPKKEKSVNPVQDFVAKYNKLCEETGLQIVTQPVFVRRDDGTFSVTLQNSVGKMPTRG